MSTVETKIKNFDLLIGGQITPASNGSYFDSINPSNGEVCAKVADASVEDMQRAIDSAREAFEGGEWKNLSVQQRGEYLKKIAKLIRDNAKELADLECRDVGKTAKHTTFIDVPTTADTFEYFGNISKELDDEINSVTAPVKSVSKHEARGVVGAIIPWNYPLIMTAWKLGPALISGNSVILKPSPNSCVSVMRLAQIIQEAGLPKGVLSIVSSSRIDVSKELVQNKDVDMISFTGGTQTGQEIMHLASGQTKKVTLELGGKSPTLVFADCDLDVTLGGVLSSIFINQGQMCTAGSRLLLEDKIYDDFVEKLVAKTKTLKIGSAQEYDTEFGPLVSVEHRDKVLAFIEKGKSEGAKLLCGGEIPKVEGSDKGAYLEPTIFGDVKNTMSIAQDEVFGPVLSIIKFSDFNEAVRIANDSQYGLSASIWTKDLKKADDVAKRLQCGLVWINTYGGFDNGAPFGGYKQSGFGRELGKEGLLEFTQTKQICRDQTPGGRPLVTSWF